MKAQNVHHYHDGKAALSEPHSIPQDIQPDLPSGSLVFHKCLRSKVAMYSDWFRTCIKGTWSRLLSVETSVCCKHGPQRERETKCFPTSTFKPFERAFNKLIHACIAYCQFDFILQSRFFEIHGWGRCRCSGPPFTHWTHYQVQGYDTTRHGDIYGDQLLFITFMPVVLWKLLESYANNVQCILSIVY
jgi:hypothetical protein